MFMIYAQRYYFIAIIETQLLKNMTIKKYIIFNIPKHTVKYLFIFKCDNVKILLSISYKHFNNFKYTFFKYIY